MFEKMYHQLLVKGYNAHNSTLEVDKIIIIIRKLVNISCL